MFAWKGKSDTSMRVSVVIPVHNEASTLSKVLVEVRKLEPYEVIIVDNGSTDGTKEIALQHNCRVIYYRDSLGNDVGRAIGAREAKGEIVLFLDGDIVMKSEELYNFIKGIRQGHEIVLNNLTWCLLEDETALYDGWKIYVKSLFEQERVCCRIFNCNTTCDKS